MAFLKAVVAAGGLLLLGAAPEWALGQSSQPDAALRGQSGARPDLLEGLTLTDDQKAKIEHIREETKSRRAALANDQRLSPEAADALRRGYERTEYGLFLEVLTPQQQREVRKRIAARRAAAGKPQYPLRRVPVSEQTPRPQ